VQSTLGGVTTTFVGNYYEVTGSAVTKYYHANGQRIAMRTGTTLNYLISDHLGSTSMTVKASDGTKTEVRYKPWGEVRHTTDNSTSPTRYTFQGQYSYVGDSATDLGARGFGLMYFGARYYDPQLGRFSSADTIIPVQSQGTQAWDRYAFVNNNPVRYTDPTGHCPWCIAVGVGAIVGALVGYGTQVYDNYQHGVTGTDAFTTNISAEPIVEGTFIGRYPANKDLAESIGGNWLNIPMKVWNSLGPAEQWERNKQWLREAIIRGDVFRLASPITEATENSGYFKELQYLFNVAKSTIDLTGKYLIPPD
jgi:RHS repeat-associated protein